VFILFPIFINLQGNYLWTQLIQLQGNYLQNDKKHILQQSNGE